MINSCESLWDLLSVYADGQATREEASLVEGHIVSCVECARDLRFMRETANLLSETPEVAPPPGLRQAILAATIYRPTWQQRVWEIGRRLLPAAPIRGLALAGSAAVLLVAAYVAVSRLPQPASLTEPIAFSGVPETGPKIATTSPPVIPAPIPPRLKSFSHDDHKGIALSSHSPSFNNTPDVEDLLAPPHRVVNTRKPQPRGPLGPSFAVHVVRDMPRPRPSTDVAPSLLPGRDVQPNDMFTMPPMQVKTADMREPMGPKGGMGTPADPMNKTTNPMRDTAVLAPPAPERARIIALASSNPEPSSAGAMVSLADLRRRLRQQNETIQIVHPELHLRAGQHDNTLDLLKSSF